MPSLAHALPITSGRPKRTAAERAIGAKCELARRSKGSIDLVTSSAVSIFFLGSRAQMFEVREEHVNTSAWIRAGKRASIDA